MTLPLTLAVHQKPLPPNMNSIFIPKSKIHQRRAGKMAFRLASGLINWTVDKLSVLLPAQVAIALGESSDSASGEDLKHLVRTMKRIQCILLDSPKDNNLDCPEKFWLEELREVAYDAEDLVEEYEYDVLHAKVQARSNMEEKVTTDLSCIDVSVPVSDEISLRAKVIRERFDEIVSEWEKLRWVESDRGKRRQSLDTVTRPPTSSLVHEPSIHGRLQDKESVIAILLDESGGGGKNQTGHCVVLPIVGMGGVGKTTLAQLIYNDSRIDSHFDQKVWVYVSTEFDVQALTQAIITSLTKKPCELMQINDLQRILEDKIRRKRFLLVLDNVWNERPILWDLFQAPLCCSRSCKILVTTRNEKVAKLMQTIPFYSLRCLEQEDSLLLFQQRAFGCRDLGEQANLLEIGRKITKKCGGLPLAIRAVGCALRFEQREELWRDLLESDLWALGEGLNEVLPALRLSYDCMPENLKECFMSLSLFPKNCIFFKENTVRFWSTLGLLKLESRRSAKDVGNQYFDDLHQRSLLQMVQYDDKTCFFLMHDLVRKLAVFVAGDTFRKLNADTLDLFTNKGRYLSVLVNELPKTIDLSSIQQSGALRALQIFNTVNQWLGKDISIELNEGFFRNLRSLRVLNFNNTGITTLPNSIGNLKMLHFLGLAKTQITTLPESISLLYNLQIMDIIGCHLRELPKGIRNLVNLRHLIVEKWSKIHMPCGMGNLANLETLPVFNIGIESGCKVSDMGMLSKLRGNLRITGLDNVQCITDVVLADLLNKQHIDVLMLDWSHCVFETGNQSSVLASDIDHGHVLEAFQPQLNLKVLEIYHYPGLSYPKWLGDSSYSTLVKVILFGNRKISCTFLPPLGQLPSLRDLSIQCLLTVQYVGSEFCRHDGQNKAFPSLNTLEFKYMPIWLYWFGVEDGDFCSLRTLNIVSCHALRSLPEFLSSSLEKLVLINCNELATVPMTLTSVTSLILMGDINKSLLVNINLPALKSLQIGSSQNIQYVVLGSMPLLEVLVIRSCKNFKSFFGLNGLKFLKELEMDECPSLVLPLDECVPPCLQTLKVTNCPGLCFWKIMNPMENFGKKSDTSDIGTDDDELPLLPTNGDDYNLEWLFTVAKKPKEHKRDELELTSRSKRLRNGSIKGTLNSSDKGKQIFDYSSGKSTRFIWWDQWLIWWEQSRLVLGGIGGFGICELIVLKSSVKQILERSHKAEAKIDTVICSTVAI